MNKNDYDMKFNDSGLILTKKEKLLHAFEKAHDIRKFEIDLYWKRTAYFWTLIAAIFAGYFLLLTTPLDKFSHKNVYLTLISSIGFSFSLAWFLAAKGSKFWQENWECHLDMLEDSITGPLYKIVLQDKSSSTLSITSPQAFSVSKINQWIAILVIFIWIFLMISPSLSFLFKEFGPQINIVKVKFLELAIELLVIASTFIFSYLMLKNTKTQLVSTDNNGEMQKKQIKAIMRTTELE